VYAFAEFKGELVAAGDGFTVDGEYIGNVVAWNGTRWRSLGGRFSIGTDAGFLFALAVFDDELIAGGEFNSAGGNVVSNIARWNGTSWSALGSGEVLDSRIYALTVHDDVLVAGGTFTAVGGLAARHIAAWNGSDWSTIGAGLGLPSTFQGVLALTVHAGELCAGGEFSTSGGEPTNQVAKWDGTTWRALAAGIANGGSASVRTLASFSGDLFAGGSFETAGNAWVGNITRWNGTDWGPLGNGFGPDGGLGFALSSYQGELIMGGYFDSVNGTTLRSIARRVGNSWQPLAGGVSSAFGTGAVRALRTFGGSLVAAGDFTTAGVTPANNIASWNGTSWEPLGGGFSGPAPRVTALASYDGELIAGGWFTMADSAIANRVARWNGTAWNPLGSGVSSGSGIAALAVYDGELVAGGAFFSAGGFPVNNIARWNGSSWRSLGTGSNSSVNALAVYAGELIAAGNFSSAGGAPASRVARWNGSSWRPLGSGLSSSAYALAVYNDELVAAEVFAQPGSPATIRIVKWNGTAWSPLAPGIGGVVSSFNPTVWALSQYGTDLVACGEFTRAGDHDSATWARWSPSLDLPSITQQPTNRKLLAGNTATFTLASTGGQPLSYQWRKDNTNLTDDGHILGATTDSLTINAASATDTGRYDCVVTNDCGAATSIAARLSVIANLPNAPLQPFQPATAVSE